MRARKLLGLFVVQSVVGALLNKMISLDTFMQLFEGHAFAATRKNRSKRNNKHLQWILMSSVTSVTCDHSSASVSWPSVTGITPRAE